MARAQSQKKSNGDGLTRREKVEHREEVILSVAMRMFNQTGFAKTTISGIARESGVADGTVYLYFKNKEALARAVLAAFYARLTQSAQDGVDKLTTPRERLVFLARHHMKHVIANWRVLEAAPILARSVDDYDGSEIYHLNKNYTAIFDRVAKNGMAQGQLSEKTPLWIMRDMFFGAMEYGCRSLLMKQRPEDADQFADAVVDTFFQNNGTASAAGAGNMADRMEAAMQRIEKAVEKLG